jgi:hypothetical protein
MLCECVCACVRACVCACVRACVRACGRVRVHAGVCVYFSIDSSVCVSDAAPTGVRSRAGTVFVNWDPFRVAFANCSALAQMFAVSRFVCVSCFL